MTAKKKTKTNKQDVWKKQEVETAILDAFSQFEASKLKDKNLFVLVNYSQHKAVSLQTVSSNHSRLAC